MRNLLRRARNAIGRGITFVRNRFRSRQARRPASIPGRSSGS
jgi:hypothetical protein